MAIELINNGDFANFLTGWTSGSTNNGSIAAGSGGAAFEANTTGDTAWIKQVVSCSPNVKINYSYDIDENSGDGPGTFAFTVGSSDEASDIINRSDTITGPPETKTGSFTPTVSTLHVKFMLSFLDFTSAILDNVALLQDANHVFSIFNGTPTITTTGPKIGAACALFNAKNEVIEAPETDELIFMGDNGTADWTLEFWFQQNGTGANAEGFVMCCGGSGNDGWHVFTGENGWGMGWGSGNFTDNSGNFEDWLTFSNVAPALNVWEHYAFERSGTTFRTYKNGTVVDTRTAVSTAILTHTENFRINSAGEDEWSINQTKGCLMKLDELRISRVARYNGTGFTPLTTPFITDTNTILLMHFEGANNSTSFIDSHVSFGSAGYPRIITFS